MHEGVDLARIHPFDFVDRLAPRLTLEQGTGTAEVDARIVLGLQAEDAEVVVGLVEFGAAFASFIARTIA